jgi:hypothetical protein
VRDSNIIQRFLAAFLLLLFSFCITPKKFLHDLLANHRDGQTAHSLPVEQISSSGFHCHIDDLVVVAPFLPGIQSLVTGISFFGILHFSEPAVSFSFACRNLPEDRGPPAIYSILS